MKTIYCCGLLVLSLVESGCSRRPLSSEEEAALKASITAIAQVVEALDGMRSVREGSTNPLAAHLRSETVAKRCEAKAWHSTEGAVLVGQTVFSGGACGVSAHFKTEARVLTPISEDCHVTFDFLAKDGVVQELSDMQSGKGDFRFRFYNDNAGNLGVDTMGMTALLESRKYGFIRLAIDGAIRYRLSNGYNGSASFSHADLTFTFTFPGFEAAIRFQHLDSGRLKVSVNGVDVDLQTVADAARPFSSVYFGSFFPTP
jgi:hypothetical protein